MLKMKVTLLVFVFLAGLLITVPASYESRIRKFGSIWKNCSKQWPNSEIIRYIFYNSVANRESPMKVLKVKITPDVSTFKINSMIEIVIDYTLRK